jgi:glycosyltransferase involved in cell wall biosynthesis
MGNKLNPRIFYCGMVNTSPYAARIGERLHIGAASNKMIALVCAMRDAGAKAYLISMPVLGIKSRRSYATATVLRDKGGPQVFLPVIANRYLRKIFAIFSFAWFCAENVRKTDRVIFYNHALEYLLGLLIIIIRGNRPILDVEDAARGDEKGWPAFVGRPLFYLFYRWSRDRKLIVSEALAEKLRLNKYCVVYGTKTNEMVLEVGQSRAPWFISNVCESIRIHYGGNLSADTGVDLFCSAVVLLIGLRRWDGCLVEFIVTGFGSEEKISELKRRCEGSGIHISYHPDLSPEEYFSQLHSCHAGLSLRLPFSPMSMTTFPSKVVEITSHGLLLISTKASDVPLLFDASNSVLLPTATAVALADAIMLVVSDPLAMQQVARRGQERAMELFDSKCVGTRVVNFVLNDDV